MNIEMTAVESVSGNAELFNQQSNYSNYALLVYRLNMNDISRNGYIRING